jgi:hypothetical protein
MGNSSGDEAATHSMTANLYHLFSDAVLFWVLQAGLVLFALFVAVVARLPGRGGPTVQIKRGGTSMGYFYATYAAISGLLVAICLSVDVAKDHRVFWVLVDTIAVGYICVVNKWFRNRLVGFAIYLSEREHR